MSKKSNRNKKVNLPILIVCELAILLLLLASLYYYRAVELSDCDKIVGELETVDRNVTMKKYFETIVSISGKEAYVYKPPRDFHSKLEEAVGKEEMVLYVIDRKNFFGFDEGISTLVEIRSENNVYYSIEQYNRQCFVQRTLATIFLCISEIMVLLYCFLKNGLIFKFKQR